MNRIFDKIIFITFLMVGAKAYAYPNFIGYQYTACLTCHYNPFGNGPLNDYGRAVSATIISDRAFYKKSKTEDEIATNSGFLYSKPKNSWFRPSFDYRGLFLQRSFGEEVSDSDLIHMQADANVVIKGGKNDKFFASFSLGYAPDPQGNPDNTEGNLRSREHYIGWRINKDNGLYIGFMDKLYGIRVPDHIAYARSSTDLNMWDQAHGILYHYSNPKVDFGAQYFLGNLGQSSEISQVGFATQIEYSVTETTRSGISIIKSSSDFKENFHKALHFRTAFLKGSTIMAEVGEAEETDIASGTKIKQQYMFMQNYIKLKRGLNSLVTVEYYRPDADDDGKIMRFGPGLQYFLRQGVELRLDVYNTRGISERAVSEDIWDVAWQLHLWF